MRFLKKLFSTLRTPSVETVRTADDTNEDWFTFKRFKGGDYWLLVVNRGLLQDSQTVSMSWFTIEYHFLQRQLDNGQMPKPEMTDLFHKFEDEIAIVIRAIRGKMAASQTGFGTRMIWFCAPSLQLEEILRSQAQKFESFSVDVSPSSFPQFESLFPDKLEQQLAGNSGILSQLLENGDDGSASREVRYWIYGNDTVALQRIAKILEQDGYQIDELTEEKVIFSRISPLTEGQVNDETMQLTSLCAAHGCEYDGWESPVVTGTLH